VDAAHLAGDVLVHPSRFETWGRAIDEAAVVGRPAVLGHTPFVAARLGDAGPDRALWIDADDPCAFDDALRRAGLDAAWRARCGERARRSATQLGWDGPVRALLSAWNDVELTTSGFRPFALPDLRPGAAPCAST
jgi:glycosyltransferase involved in cell wall biosynthesis